MLNPPEVPFTEAVNAELDDARATFHHLLGSMSPQELRQPTVGTKWNNREMLFHMLFGYLIVRSLIPIVKLFGHLPGWANAGFAALLDYLTGPFNLVNYLGSRLGATIVGPSRMGAQFDRVTTSLGRKLAAEPDRSLRLVMHFPTKWDPFFKDQMSLADVYHYPYQHFMFHRAQLSAGESRPG